MKNFITLLSFLLILCATFCRGHHFFEPGAIHFPLRDVQQSINYESFASSQRNTTVGRCETVSRHRVVALNLPNLDMQSPLSPYPGFIDSHDVSCLNLASNEIRQIVPGSFERLPNLAYLDLSRNHLQLCDFFNFGSSHPSLTTLIIEDNRPPADNIDKTISRAECLPQLRYLYVRRNSIRNIKFSLKAAFPALTHLFLSDNSLDSNAFIHHLPESLTHLYLERNLISSLDCKIMRGLETLRLDGNIIGSICLRSCQDTSLKLAGVHKLRELSVSDNRLIDVESCAFQEATRLEVLDLSRNELSNVKVETFDALISLSELNLDDNLLRSVPNLFNNVKLTSLSIRRNKLQVIERRELQNLKSLRVLQLGGNRIRSISAGSFEDLDSLAELDLSNNELDFIPSDLLKWQWNLRTLDVRGNRFKTLEQMSLSHAPVLNLIYLQNNPITHLSGSILSKLASNLVVHLESDCSSNKRQNRDCYAKCDLDEVRLRNATYSRWINNHGSFIDRPRPPIEFPMKNIQYSIDIESNSTYESNFTSKFQDYYRSDGYVLNLPNLKLEEVPNPYPNFIESDQVVAVNLRNNGIYRIKPDSFDSIPRLQYLDLSSNRLAFCDFFNYGSCLRNLITLVIENNQLPSDSLYREISQAGCFPEVQNLYLRNNHIKKLNFSLRQSFPRLVSLYLSDNEIDNCIFLQDVPASLEHLYVERNRIYGISRSILCNLRTLKADGNIIRSICYKKCGESALQLVSTSKLQVLSLSNNRITEIESCAFHDSYNLESLDLSSNGLETLHTATLIPLRALKTLILDDNQLRNWPQFNGNWHLKILSIRNNKLQEIRKELFSQVTSLEQLLLGGNCIKTIASNTFEGLTWLEELDLSRNKIECLPAGWMKDLKSLKSLDLRGNKFKYVYQLSLTCSSHLTDVYLENNRLSIDDKDEIQRYFPYAQVHLDSCSRRCQRVSVRTCGALISCH
ncbi:protein artichoke-like [Trichogramma pretiosum]|uniref:protein artichoke-like n=1 Tax=Trichogramma pretiosum TaxID=7493 RepID=UPI000C7196D8|nr:protein artichoke-like [Trichogramma pretiosum]